MNGRVDTRMLKEFAGREFKHYGLTRRLILEEPDYITPEEFAMKCRVWLRLLASEAEAGNL